MAILGFAGRWPESIDAQAQLQYVKARAAQSSATSASHQQTPAGLVFGPFVHSAQGVTIAVSGKPVHPGDASITNPRTIRRLDCTRRTRNRGAASWAQLTGSFALAIVDENAGLVLLAIDRMGIERMTWASVGDAIVFGESAESVAHFPAINAGIRRAGAARLPDAAHGPGAAHDLRGRAQAAPGHALRISARAEPRCSRTGSRNSKSAELAPFSALRDDVHAALDAAVRDCKPGERTGSFLSGGLDSSTVSGMLARVGNRARPHVLDRLRRRCVRRAEVRRHRQRVISAATPFSTTSLPRTSSRRSR